MRTTERLRTSRPATKQPVTAARSFSHGNGIARAIRDFCEPSASIHIKYPALHGRRQLQAPRIAASLAKDVVRQSKRISHGKAKLSEPGNRSRIWFPVRRTDKERDHCPGH